MTSLSDEDWANPKCFINSVFRCHAIGCYQEGRNLCLELGALTVLGTSDDYETTTENDDVPHIAVMIPVFVSLNTVLILLLICLITLRLLKRRKENRSAASAVGEQTEELRGPGTRDSVRPLQDDHATDARRTRKCPKFIQWMQWQWKQWKGPRRDVIISEEGERFVEWIAPNSSQSLNTALPEQTLSEEDPSHMLQFQCEARMTSLMLAQLSDAAGHISAAPLCLAILGHLNLLATGPDFSLRSKNFGNAEHAFRFLLQPDSFNASLCRISDMGHKAFMQANTSMDKIRIYALEIPEHMKQTAYLLMNDSSALEKKEFLLVILEKMKVLAERSMNEVKLIVENYDEVLNTLSELEEATIVAVETTKQDIETMATIPIVLVSRTVGAATNAREALTVIHQGLGAFRELEYCWKKLLTSFSRLSEMAAYSLSRCVDLFYMYVSSGSTRSEMTLLYIRDIIQEVIVASTTVNVLASCYFEVSRHHLVPLASRLGTLIALDSVADRQRIEQEKDMLRVDAAKAQQCIRELVIKHRSGQTGVTSHMDDIKHILEEQSV